MKYTPLIVGIVGPSGSGKTTVGSKIKSRSKDYEHVRLDDYLKDPKTFPKKNGFVNWERPANFSYEKLVKHLTKLSKGEKVRFMKKYGNKKFLVELKPKKFIIVEGILLLKNKKLKELLGKKIFLDIPVEFIPRRRKMRNGKNYYRPYDLKVVIPEYLKNGIGQKQEADIVIDGRQPIHKIVKTLKNILEKQAA